MPIATTLRNVVENFVIEAELDRTGLWEVLRIAGAIKDIPANLALKAKTLIVVTAMLRRGFLAVTLQRVGETDDMVGIPWPDQSPAAVCARIDREWTALGRDPNLWEICWFELPGWAR